MLSSELILLYLQLHGYLALYLISIIEGPIVTVLASFLASFSYLNVYVVFLIAMLGDLTGDLIYYSIGFFGKNKFLKKLIKIFKISENKILDVENFYEKHGGKSIIFSKFLQGMSIIVLVGAGASKMKLPKFLFFSISSSIIKTAILVFLGFYFGRFYTTIRNYFGVAGQIGLITTILIITIIIFLKIYKKRKTKN